MANMNTVEEFYRKRTVLEKLGEWRSLFVYYLTDDNKVSILFQSDIRSFLTEKEEKLLSRKIILLLVDGQFCTRNFIEMLQKELAELKATIKKDFDL